MLAPPGPARSSLALAAALALAACLSGAAAGAADNADTVKQSMRRVLDGLSTLLPLALSEETAPWAEQKPAVRGAMDALGAASEQIAAHGYQKDASFRFLSQSLAGEIRILRQTVQREDYTSAAFATERVVETCIACHLRLPADTGPRDLAGALMKHVDRSTLSLFSRANLESAARQFDTALDTYEAGFKSSGAAYDAVDFSDALSSYLIVALRVKRDAARAVRGIDLLERRDDLSAQLELNLKIWRRALQELGPALGEAPSLERARSILNEGRGLSEFPLDAADQIHCVVASSLVFRYLEEKRPEGSELAEALYLLARTEAFTRRAFDISEAGSYLEQAINAAPHTAIAERAYARLELQTVLQFAGSEGQALPREVRAWLKELRERSQAGPRRTKPRSRHDT